MVPVRVELQLDLNPEVVLKILNAPQAQAGSVGAQNLAVQKILKRYVDAWINISVRADGSEAPNDRNHSRAIQNALSSTGSPDELMLANSLGSFFDTHEIKAFWPPGAEEPMWRTHPNDVDQHRYPHQKAISLLVPLLLSEFRYRIGRCRYKGCESYFFLPQKRRNLYLHGLFCSPSCNRAMSATQLTKQRRSDFDSQIEGYVATLLLLRKWKPLDGAEGIKKKVLPKVNSYIAHGNPKLRHGRKLSNRGNYISGNWLTKHWDEICAKAKKMDSSPPCPFQDRPCN